MAKISLKKLFPSSTKGQSLVETAIIAPLLIFMLIGVFEVGWALRGYLILVNVNREIARFSVRPGYMDFSTQDQVNASYQRIQGWALTALSGQLEMDFKDTGHITDTGNTTLIISHVVIDTGLPCEDIMTNPGGCDCDQFENNPGFNPFPLDDLIVHPDRPGMEYQAQQFGPLKTETGTRITRIKYMDLVSNTLAPQNNKFNCEILKKGGVPSVNNFIVTELFFDQPQLFGFPLISNPFTDPVPLYTHTTMRLVSAARGSGQEGGDPTATINTTGPVCNAYPFAVHRDTIEYGTDNKLNQMVDIFDGNGGGGDWGWLAWNPGEVDQADLEKELQFSTTALNNFIDAKDFADGVPFAESDRILSVGGGGDWVASIPSSMASVNDPPGELVNALVGTPIRIPVWDSFVAGRYHIVGFAWVQIESVSDIKLAAPDHEVKATYLGDASEGCP